MEVKKDQAEKDAVHQALGGVGRFQMLVQSLLCLVHFGIAFQIFAMNFLTPDNLAFWCDQPEESRTAVTAEEWNSTFPRPRLSDSSIDECHIYDLDYANLDRWQNLSLG